MFDTVWLHLVYSYRAHVTELNQTERTFHSDFQPNKRQEIRTLESSDFGVILYSDIQNSDVDCIYFNKSNVWLLLVLTEILDLNMLECAEL